MAVRLLDADGTIDVKDSDLADVTDGDPDTVYTVRQIPPHVNRQLSKQHSTMKRGQYTIDHIELMDSLLDYALVGWVGIQDKGTPAPLTKDNKARLDYPRKVAILQIAGLNQVTKEADRADSFRSTT